MKSENLLNEITYMNRNMHIRKLLNHSGSLHEEKIKWFRISLNCLSIKISIRNHKIII